MRHCMKQGSINTLQNQGIQLNEQQAAKFSRSNQKRKSTVI